MGSAWGLPSWRARLVYFADRNCLRRRQAARQGRFAAGAATPVGIAAAAKGDIPVVVRALGTVTPLNTVNVKTQITGQLIKVEFKEGQMVKQGDLLAVVDPRPYDVALQQAIGTMQKDEALLKNAQIDLDATRSWSPRTRSPASSTTPRSRSSASTKRRW